MWFLRKKTKKGKIFEHLGKNVRNVWEKLLEKALYILILNGEQLLTSGALNELSKLSLNCFRFKNILIYWLWFNITTCNLNNNAWLTWISGLFRNGKDKCYNGMETETFISVYAYRFTLQNIYLSLQWDRSKKKLQPFPEIWESLAWIKKSLFPFNPVPSVLSLFGLSLCRMIRTEPWKMRLTSHNNQNKH